jgi:hypothetical protein
MKRRDFITLFSAGAMAWPLAAPQAQRPIPVVTISINPRWKGVPSFLRRVPLTAAVAKCLVVS